MKKHINLSPYFEYYIDVLPTDILSVDLFSTLQEGIVWGKMILELHTSLGSFTEECKRDDTGKDEFYEVTTRYIDVDNKLDVVFGELDFKCKQITFQEAIDWAVTNAAYTKQIKH